MGQRLRKEDPAILGDHRALRGAALLPGQQQPRAACYRGQAGQRDPERAGAGSPDRRSLREEQQEDTADSAEQRGTSFAVAGPARCLLRPGVNGLASLAHRLRSDPC